MRNLCPKRFIAFQIQYVYHECYSHTNLNNMGVISISSIWTYIHVYICIYVTRTKVHEWWWHFHVIWQCHRCYSFAILKQFWLHSIALSNICFCMYEYTFVGMCCLPFIPAFCSWWFSVLLLWIFTTKCPMGWFMFLVWFYFIWYFGNRTTLCCTYCYYRVSSTYSYMFDVHIWHTCNTELWMWLWDAVDVHMNVC